jgi:hypothetical protein
MKNHIRVKEASVALQERPHFHIQKEISLKQWVSLLRYPNI